MINKVLKAINDFDLLGDSKHMTVALSGGADSMALLTVMSELKECLGITLDAAHFNHQIRGAEADRDQDFVAEYCKNLGIKLFIGSCDVPAVAEQRGLSLELAAREERYKFLEDVGSGVIATAHTLSDNLETVLFNLTRGTALKGLCGIPASRDVFIRPLIYCTRQDVENYCREREIPYVTDTTNLCDDYTRNKIRHNVVPVLREINPAVEETLQRTVTSLREDNEFLENLADNELRSRIRNDNSLFVEGFYSLHKSVAKRVIAKYCFICLSDNADNLHINQIYDICLKGGKISVSGNNSAVVSKGFLFFEKNGTIAPKFSYEIKTEEKNSEYFKNVHGLLLNNALDCDKIVGKLVFRTRLPGDRVYLNKANGTKTLKKLYTEYAIPLSERSVWPVISDDKGVVWVNGIGVAKRCAVTNDTKKALCIEVITK